MLPLIFAAGQTLLALPGWNRPRVIFEAGSPVQRWYDAGYQDAYTPLGRCRRLLLKCKALVAHPRHFMGNDASPVLPSFISELGLLTSRWVAIVGRNDQRQKWTLISLGNNSQPLAFMKYGETTISQSRVLNEAQILEALPPGLGPQLLKWGTVARGVALVMTVLKGQSLVHRPLSLQTRCMVFEWINRLSEGQSARGAEHPAIGKREFPLEMHAVVERLAEDAWPLGWQHGDATPWNLIETRDAGVLAIDWEDARADGCPLLDIVYYVLQTHFFLRHTQAGHARLVACEWLRAWGVSKQKALALVRLSAYDAWERWQADGWHANHPVQLYRKQIWFDPENY